MVVPLKISSVSSVQEGLILLFTSTSVTMCVIIADGANLVYTVSIRFCSVGLHAVVIEILNVPGTHTRPYDLTRHKLQFPLPYPRKNSILTKTTLLQPEPIIYGSSAWLLLYCLSIPRIETRDKAADVEV